MPDPEGPAPGMFKRIRYSPLRAQVERPAVVVPPSHVVDVLGGDDRAQMRALRRNDPQAAWAGDVEVYPVGPL